MYETAGKYSENSEIYSTDCTRFTEVRVYLDRSVRARWYTRFSYIRMCVPLVECDELGMPRMMPPDDICSQLSSLLFMSTVSQSVNRVLSMANVASHHRRKLQH